MKSLPVLDDADVSYLIGEGERQSNCGTADVEALASSELPFEIPSEESTPEEEGGGNQMGVRRQAREVAVQAIYMMDFNSNWNAADQLEIFFSTFESLETVREFARELVIGVAEHRERLDALISKASENWSIGRMARVDRAILRLATFELCCLSDIPSTVSINEAIEVAKRFGSDDSPTFINGVVDRIAHYVSLAEPKASEASEEAAVDAQSVQKLATAS